MPKLSDFDDFATSLAAISTMDDVGADTPLADLGLDSAEFLAWFYRIEDDNDVSLGQEALLDAFTDGVTVGRLHAVLAGIAAHRSTELAADTPGVTR